MTTLTRWLLRTLALNWEGGLPSDSDDGGPLRFYDRDDSVLLSEESTGGSLDGFQYDTATYDGTELEPVRRTQSADLTVSNILGVALVSNFDTPAGLGGSEYRHEPILSVRIEGAHEREHGNIKHAAEFATLYDTALDIVQGINESDLDGAPVANYHVADPTDTNPQMSNYTDYFRFDFDVSATGYGTV